MNNHAITVTYRDNEIWYNESTEVWECQLDTTRYKKSQNLKSVKDAIDKFFDSSEKIKKVFDRFEIIGKAGYGNEFDTLTVTSITDENTCWVVTKNGERKKVSDYELSSVYMKTPENISIIEQIKSKEKEVDHINKEIGKLRSSLQTVNLKEILKQIS